jgi:hypothetical protein
MSDDAADEVLVTVEPETPPPPKAGEPEVKVATDDDAVNELKAQFAQLETRANQDREARDAAEQRARQHAQEAERARQEVESVRTESAGSQLDAVTAGISTAETEATAAEAAYARAMEDGNFAEAAKAQRRMARAEADLGRLNEAKADIEIRKAQPRPEPQIPDDPFEAYVAGRTEPTAKWLRNHRDWVVDPRKNAKLTSAHWAAVAEGLSADTDRYFEFVEIAIGERKGADEKTAPKKSSPPVAPVSRGGNGASIGSGSSNEVRLSKSEALAATDGTLVWNFSDPSGQNKFKKGDPIGINEFARRKRQMQLDGLYDKSYLEQ